MQKEEVQAPPFHPSSFCLRTLRRGGQGNPTFDTAKAIAVMLEKLLKDELKVRSKRNLVQSQVFSEKLKKTLNAYHNRAILTMQVIEELIKLAKDLDAATKRGEDMGLTDDEIALTPSLPLSRAAPIAARCLPAVTKE